MGWSKHRLNSLRLYKGAQFQSCEVTFNIPYQFAMAYANISSLHACREDLNKKKFFRKILNNPNHPLFDLLPPPRDAAIIGRLRSAHLLPVLRTRTSKYRSFIQSRFDPLPAKVKMTAENRRGKEKEEERKKPQLPNIMSASDMQGGHHKPNGRVILLLCTVYCSAV